MFFFLILKNFSWVLGNQPLWSLLLFQTRCLCSLGWRTAYSLQIYNTRKEIGGSESTLRRKAMWRSTRAATCRDTYLCGSCVHVWARPDTGTVVDSTHLLHKCKEPDPAFCKRNISKCERTGALSEKLLSTFLNSAGALNPSTNLHTSTLKTENTCRSAIGSSDVD